MSNEQVIKLLSGGLMSEDYLKHALDSFLMPEEQQAFVEACGRPLRKSVRVNTLKCSLSSFQKIADSYGWQLQPIPWCGEGFWIACETLDANFSIGNLPEHIQGLFYIQEASSMLPAMALFSQESIIQGEKPLVVDMAAAPGSKTTQIAAMLKNRGIVLANELSASRLKSLHNNLVRCGILNTCMSHLDARKIGELMPGCFDYVLLDAPCGGEGTVRKDVNALDNWRLSKVEELAELQKQLVLSAYRGLKPGGTMVYSTCTLSKQENQQVAKFLVEQTDAVVQPLNDLFDGAERAATEEGYLHVLPHIFDSEGFFVARFSKPSTAFEGHEIKPIYSSPFVPPNNKVRQQFIDYYRSQFDINIEPSGYELLQRDKEIWLFPKAIERVNRYLKVNRGGMKMALLYPNKIRSSHEMACCFGDSATKQILDITPSQLESYWRGQNISIENKGLQKGEVLLRFSGKVLGVAQLQNSKVKNNLPRELVRDNYRLP